MGISLWIGGGWCARPEWQGRHACERAPKGIHAIAQKRPQLKKGGAGVHRAAYAIQPWKPRPCLKGQGITRQLPDIGGNDGASGRGVHAKYAAGYEGEYDFPSTWECVQWKANGGYGNQGESTRGRANAFRERIWFSPHCLQAGLFPLFAG
jgi:hypothetical protein